MMRTSYVSVETSPHYSCRFFFKKGYSQMHIYQIKSKSTFIANMLRNSVMMD